MFDFRVKLLIFFCSSKHHLNCEHRPLGKWSCLVSYCPHAPPSSTVHNHPHHGHLHSDCDLLHTVCVFHAVRHVLQEASRRWCRHCHSGRYHVHPAPRRAVSGVANGCPTPDGHQASGGHAAARNRNGSVSDATAGNAAADAGLQSSWSRLPASTVPAAVPAATPNADADAHAGSGPTDGEPNDDEPTQLRPGRHRWLRPTGPLQSQLLWPVSVG